jgi:protein-disulfide isomerase
MQNNNQAKKSWYKKWWRVLIIVVGALILINLVAFGFYVGSIVKDLKNSETINKKALLKYSELNAEIREKIEGKNNYWIGSANPKITIVEFGDFACPYCKKSFPKMREISVKYKDNVKVIFRDMPLQENSLVLAMAGRCAGEQGLFWLMHDKLFQNQGVKSADELTELANQIGADISRFKNCLNSSKYIKQIQKDLSDGQYLGVRGTPTWFVNGVKVEGDVPLGVWEEIIGKLLQKF